MLKQKTVTKLIEDALAIENEEASQVGALGYMAKVFVQTTMPHRNQYNLSTFERTNGNSSLVIMGHPKLGLPYGIYPRLILSWITTEAVRTKTPELILGCGLNQFMSQLGLLSTGGRWGTISRLRDQMCRLLSSSVSCVYKGVSLSGGAAFNISKEYKLWWDIKNSTEAGTVTLGKDFFDEITKSPIPIDMRALQALKGSSVALDLYCWLTHRFSYLKNKSEIPWSLLQQQFGANYAETKQGKYTFKLHLLSQLKKVLIVYPEANVSEEKNGLILTRSPSHIRSKVILNG